MFAYVITKKSQYVKSIISLLINNLQIYQLLDRATSESM